MNPDQVVENISHSNPTGAVFALIPLLVYAHGIAVLYFLFGGRPTIRVTDCYRNCLTPTALAFVAVWFVTGHAPTAPDADPTYSTLIALLPLALPMLLLVKETWSGLVQQIRRTGDEREARRQRKRQSSLNAARQRENSIRLEQERIERERNKQLQTVQKERLEMNEERHAKTLREMTMKVDLVYKQLESKLPSNVRGLEFDKLKSKHLNEAHTPDELQANATSVIHLLQQLHQEQLLESERREISRTAAVDHHDMETAILYFQKRQQKISQMPIDEDDKERLIISLNEKREEVLDSYL